MKPGCKEVIDKLYLYLDRELPDDEFTRLKHHIETCGGCLERYGVEAEFKELVRRRCSEREPHALVQQIREALHREVD